MRRLESLESAIAALKTDGKLAEVDMPFDVYRQVSAVHHSDLCLMDQSAAHFKHATDFKRKQTPAMALGTAIHMAVLEPERFNATYAELPSSIKKNTKAGKAAFAEWEAANKGRVALAAKDMRLLQNVHQRATDHRFNRAFFARGHSEVSFFAKDPETGLNLCCRTDKWIPEARVVIDLKTTDCANPWVFKKDMRKYHYFTQAAYYMDTIALATGAPVKAYVIVALEKSAPYLLRGFRLSPRVLDWGRMRYRNWLRQLKRCVEDDVWPGYDEGVMEVDAEGWMVEELEAVTI